MNNLKEKVAHLEDHFKLLGDIIAQHEDYVKDSEREWRELEARIEKRQESMVKTLEEMKLRNETFQASKRGKTEGKAGMHENGEASGNFLLRNSTEGKGGSILGTFIMPFCNEIMSKCQEWRSPIFLTCHQGYRMCLKVEGHKLERCFTISLYAVPGDGDANLMWPAFNNEERT